jgi:hypothetical protein
VRRSAGYAATQTPHERKSPPSFTPRRDPQRFPAPGWASGIVSSHTNLTLNRVATLRGQWLSQGSAVWLRRTVDPIEQGTQPQHSSPLLGFAHLIVKIDHPHVAAVPIRTTTSGRPGAHMTTETSAGEPARLPPHLGICGIIEMPDHGAGDDAVRDSGLAAKWSFRGQPPLRSSTSRRTSRGPNADQTRTGPRPADHLEGEILCYYMGFL